MTRIGVVAIGRETFDTELAAATSRRAFDALGTVGVEVVGRPALLLSQGDVDAVAPTMAGAHLDALVVLQATFADSSMVVSLAERVDAPVVLWSFPEPRTGGRLRLNSLCGVNLAAHALRRRSLDHRVVHGTPEDPGIGDAFLEALATPMRAVDRAQPGDASAGDDGIAAAVVGRLAGRRIGVIGDHPVGFDPCRYDAAAIATLTGVTVERRELDELFRAADAVPSERMVEVRRRVDRDVDGVDRLDERGVEQSLRLYGGLRTMVDDCNWSAVATRCWPECMTVYGGAACAPQAMLSADGTPGMCEADVLGSLTALVLQELSGGTAFVADLVDIDIADDTAVLWHCGLASIDLADPGTRPDAIEHTNRHVPLLHEFALRPGRITVARLSQAADEPAMVIGGGAVLARPRPFAGTSGVIRFDRPAGRVLDTVMAAGLEHHYGIVYGDHRGPLRALARRWSLPVIDLDA